MLRVIQYRTNPSLVATSLNQIVYFHYSGYWLIFGGTSRGGGPWTILPVAAESWEPPAWWIPLWSWASSMTLKSVPWRWYAQDQMSRMQQMNHRGRRTVGPSAVPSALPTSWKPSELKMWSKRHERMKNHAGLSVMWLHLCYSWHLHFPTLTSSVSASHSSLQVFLFNSNDYARQKSKVISSFLLQSSWSDKMGQRIFACWAAPLRFLPGGLPLAEMKGRERRRK